jgi:hypothetical protein
MDHDQYRAEVLELYLGEVIGEGGASRGLELTTVPEQQYKLALLLQLESEAKARLRPFLWRHRLSLVEEPGHRTAGAEAADKFSSMPWTAAMAELAAFARPFLERYQALLSNAPREDLPWVRFMVEHERAVVHFAEREAQGEPDSDHELLPLLLFPITRHGQRESTRLQPEQTKEST